MLFIFMFLMYCMWYVFFYMPFCTMYGTLSSENFLNCLINTFYWLLTYWWMLQSIDRNSVLIHTYLLSSHLSAEMPRSHPQISWQMIRSDFAEKQKQPFGMHTLRDIGLVWPQIGINRVTGQRQHPLPSNSRINLRGSARRLVHSPMLHPSYLNEKTSTGNWQIYSKPQKADHYTLCFEWNWWLNVASLRSPLVFN